MGLTEQPIDYHLIAALEAGLPECAGVALGIDRLIMLALGEDHIDKVTAFPFPRA
jgi:lysyl-tRNA synthetase class 2